MCTNPLERHCDACSHRRTRKHAPFALAATISRAHKCANISRPRRHRRRRRVRGAHCMAPIMLRLPLLRLRLRRAQECVQARRLTICILINVARACSCARAHTHTSTRARARSRSPGTMQTRILRFFASKPKRPAGMYWQSPGRRAECGLLAVRRVCVCVFFGSLSSARVRAYAFDWARKPTGNERK